MEGERIACRAVATGARSSGDPQYMGAGVFLGINHTLFYLGYRLRYLFVKSSKQSGEVVAGGPGSASAGFDEGLKAPENLSSGPFF